MKNYKYNYLIIAFFCIFSLQLFAQEPRLMIPIGHTDAVTSAVYSPDGKRIVTGSLDNTAKVWDAQSGQLILDLKGHSGHINFAIFSPDGKQIVTGAWDKTAKVWDAQTGQMLLDLKGHLNRVRSAVYSPDRKRILTSAYDNTAKVWDAQTGQMLLDLKSSVFIMSKSSKATFSPDGKRILTESLRDNNAKVWDTETGRLLLDLKGHKMSIKSVTFSPDGKQILTGSTDTTAKVWDTETGKMLLNIKGHKGSISSAMYSPDGKRILIGSSDKTAKVWDTQTGQLLLSLTGHKKSISSAVYSPDGKQVLTKAEDTTSKVWDAQTGQLLLDLKGHKGSINSAVYSPDGRRILTGSWDKTAKVWDAQTGQILLDLKGHSEQINLYFSPDGDRILIKARNETFKLWDLKTGKFLLNLKGIGYSNLAIFSPDGKRIITEEWGKTAEVWDTQTGQLLLSLKGNSGSISCATFSPDGKRIATGSRDTTAKIWDAQTGQFLLNLKGVGLINFITFSPDGKWIVTGEWGKNSKVWDGQTGQLLLDLKGNIWAATFSPDGEKIMIGKSIFENTVKAWSILTGQLILDLKNQTGKLHSATFSPNGRQIMAISIDTTFKMRINSEGKRVSSSSAETIKVWDAQTGQLLLDLDGHVGSIKSAVYSPDGKRILTGSYDKTAKVWDAQTGQLLLDLKGHTEEINRATFNQDGKRIMTNTWDETAKVWDAETGQLLFNLKGNTRNLHSEYSPNGKLILTYSQGSTYKLWNAETGEELYTVFNTNSTDYLVVDKYGRYDGTEGAKKLVYYVCSDEIIDLDQFKELGWERNLAAKIMGIDPNPIKAKGIKDLDICGRTPQIEERGKKQGYYQYHIASGKGAIGNVEVSVNSKVVKTIPTKKLKAIPNGYELSIAEADLIKYFVDGQPNQIMVRAKTADNTLFSRGVPVAVPATKKVIIPNLYIVSVGVSAYKGERLKLRFAGKDAIDFSAALSKSARALLNADGKEHVHVYTLSTENNSTGKPYKTDITQTFAKIKLQATANDIVVVFFAGHGKVSGNLFYFLTAEASALDINGVENQVAISSTELDDWLREIKAQKQLLILDACNSGQALVNMIASAKREMPDDHRRALERLKDRTGTFILTASASNQAAYEATLFNQGLLTYSLLYGIKSGNGLRSNNYLDVSTWFNFAADHVKTLATEIGINERQTPETIGRASFDIGLVNEAVKQGIVLSNSKKFFTRSKFFINPDWQNDDEKMADLTDKTLNEMSLQEKESPFTFVSNATGEDSYSIRGRYEIKGDEIIIHYNLMKGEKSKVNSDKVKGKLDKKNELVKQMVEQAKVWIKK